MASVFTVALFDHIAADVAGLTALGLAPYPGMPGAIFTGPAPGDAVEPFIVIRRPEQDRDNGCKDRDGRIVVRDVITFDSAGRYGHTGDPDRVEDIAEAIRALFHRRSVAVPGWDAYIVETEGPTVAQDGPDFFGLAVEVNMTTLAT